MDGAPDVTNPEHRFALAYAEPTSRDAFAALFRLMERCEQVVRRANDPLAAQMRLAWHRGVLSDESMAGPGDADMRAICRAWPGHTKALIAIADGWEELLGEHPDIRHAAGEMAEVVAALAQALGCDGTQVAASRTAGLVWIGTSLALVQRARGEEAGGISELRPVRLPRVMRPLAILSGLARRAEADGRVALLGDRLSPLAAMRLGIFGR